VSADLIARYGPHDLAVFMTDQATPWVYYDGQLRLALDVTIDGHGLTAILPASQFLPVARDLWALCDHTAEDGAVTGMRFRVLALEADRGDGFADGLILADGAIHTVHALADHVSFVGYTDAEEG
jgi:hypothetical protein